MTTLESVPTKLIIRIGLLSLVAVLVQETVISKISIFGVDADITPLVVMSIGLLCGSMTGAVTGFFIGLMVDTVIPPMGWSRSPAAPPRPPSPGSG